VDCPTAIPQILSPLLQLLPSDGSIPSSSTLDYIRESGQEAKDP
jgi:hypothetical protein